MDKIIKYKIKIDKINLTDNSFNLYSSDNILFFSEIIKGSVKFKIFNEMDYEMSLFNLEEGELVTIYGNIMIENKIIIKKIIIKNKYILDSDSSEDIDENIN